MVVDPLHDVPRHPGIEIGDGQVHELDKEIRDQGDQLAIILGNDPQTRRTAVLGIVAISE